MSTPKKLGIVTGKYNKFYVWEMGKWPKKGERMDILRYLRKFLKNIVTKL